MLNKSEMLIKLLIRIPPLTTPSWNKMLFLRKITHVCYNRTERRYGMIWQEK